MKHSIFLFTLSKLFITAVTSHQFGYKKVFFGSNEAYAEYHVVRIDGKDSPDDSPFELKSFSRAGFASISHKLDTDVWFIHSGSGDKSQRVGPRSSAWIDYDKDCPWILATTNQRALLNQNQFKDILLPTVDQLKVERRSRIASGLKAIVNKTSRLLGSSSKG
ncbi:hypothetical protein MJO28_003977 [Puccinia striiformis f. sp. tritici]|uniref:Uncharacterized protein n=4 Tax=Puccinia striiformis TaxID=27350 RepID=A0A0L0VQ33_9BASI|nr:hypothetical protein MJO28_003977 [Puccinia striiformis f. sp. tritici]KAI9627110.1 hypothetical protein KEM48_010019 [Puccinia striiformis f. sp. tritici PST-130]KNF01393.1 hypothetical protein PSTG_05491 [Puccinia striiformis f. sp. tritici PST-78]POW05230.1 hypothetical protein PSTT_09859 [Puccinia striiformis]KAI7963923.1 hypothetical protein MJO29_004350 [Puccinia striiformis f. sp. tritici]